MVCPSCDSEERVPAASSGVLMTKARDPKARPEVAKKDADKVSGVYDFVQSPEWQEVLDNARKQQESNAPAGKAKARAVQPSGPDGHKPTQSTAGSQPADPPNTSAGQPKTAGTPTQATNSRQVGESVQNATAGGSGSQSVNNNSHAADNVPRDEDNVPRDERGEASAALPNGGPVPGMHPDNIPEDLINPEPSLKLSEDEVADRLRKNLLERIEDQKRSRRKMRLGMMAVGCGIGVVASSSVFLILSGLSASGPNENVDLTSQEALATSAITQQDTELTQRPEPSSDATRDAENLAVSSTTVFDTSAETISPDGDTGASEGLASQSLPLPEASRPSGDIEPELSGVAYNVRSLVPTLVQPPLPITPLRYRPREERNLGFVRLQSTPEIFSTSVALLEATVTAAEPEEFLEAATVTATATLTIMRPPVVPIQPGALENAASQVPLDVHQTVPEHARAYQPDLGTQTGEATGSDLSLPEAVASLEIEKPPESRVLVEPGSTSSNTVASDLAVQQEDTGHASSIPQSLSYEPEPEPLELAALLVAPKLPDAPARLVTPSLSGISPALQTPSLAPTLGSLETPYSPRTPLPLDAGVSLTPLLQEASAPSTPIERTALPDDALTPPEPEPLELAALLVAPKLPDAPARLVTPSLSGTSSALQAPTLSPTLGSLETPDSSRTPLPLDAEVSLTPLLQEASAPSTPIERTALPDDALTPPEPEPEPVELAALLVAPKLPDAPARLVTPSLSGTSPALQAPTISRTLGSLETPDSSRAPLPLDAEVSLAPLLQEASAPSTPIERTALPDDAITPPEPEPAPASTVVAFRLYSPTNVPQSVVDSVVTNLTSTGHELSGQARVGFGITQSNVRFYHKQDEERAAALAKASGALLRDFTGANVKTPNGIIELWLAGEGSGVAEAKRSTKRSTARAQAPNRVNRLKSQVLSKLKKATTQ
ncbi:hypothetical protein RUM4293_03724 [Ruegeria atlantica]|uniref:Uncharacterized protein n=2 Tax=Ruegeria atlantica TaxID=81569 RepID=A0A0P1EQU1_9RHOB|nr:hypothetical protein RUM4293_03724 [Ruegeria atlantica]